MNKRFLLIVLALGQVSAGWAQEPVADLYDPTAPGAFVGEAARATMGRVFGVADAEADIQYHVYDMTAHSPKSSAIRSLLVPGWGQGFNRQRTKGILLFTAFAAAGFGSLHLYHRSQDSYDEYQAAGAKESPLYDDYDHQLTQATILGGLALFLWGYAVVDAYRNAYNPLWSRSSELELAWAPHQQEIRWKKRF